MKILYVCSGNTCRSPMAEGLTELMAQQRGLDITVSSAGVAASVGCGASYGAVCAVETAGGDISGHTAQQVNADILNDADLILTMTEGHRAYITRYYPKTADKVFSLAEYAGLNGDVQDPFGGDSREYIACAVRIAELIGKVLDKIKAEDIK